jgi:hypothetical protein
MLNIRHSLYKFYGINLTKKLLLNFTKTLTKLGFG